MKKVILPHGEKQTALQTAAMLSKLQEAHQKSEQQHLIVEDKRQEARREHTNGSTPAKRF